METGHTVSREQLALACRQTQQSIHSVIDPGVSEEDGLSSSATGSARTIIMHDLVNDTMLAKPDGQSHLLSCGSAASCNQYCLFEPFAEPPSTVGGLEVMAALIRKNEDFRGKVRPERLATAHKAV